MRFVLCKTRLRRSRSESPPWLHRGLVLAGLQLSGTRRLLISLLFAAAIPVLLFAGWVGYLAAEQERANARRAISDTVAGVAERVTSELTKELAIAETLAASASLDGPDLETFYAEAQRLTAVRPLWETVSLVDLTGSQVVNTLRPLGGAHAPTADRVTFQEVVRTRKPAIGGIGPVGPISGKRLVALSVPVSRDGSLHHVLTIGLVPDGIRSVLRHAGAPKDWLGAIVDGRGNIIARTQAEEYEAGRPASHALREAIVRAPQGFYGGRTLEGVEVETVFRTLPETGGWSVHFGLPSRALNASVTRSVIVLVLGGLASLALAGALAGLVARDVAQRRRQEEMQAALALRISEERGAVAVEAAELGTWRWDLGRDEVIGSERTRVLLGLPCSILNESGESGEAHWTSCDLLAAVHEDDRATLNATIGRCARDSRPIDIEFRSVRRDATVRWLRMTGRVPHPNGTPARVVHGVISDVEPRKQAEAERRRLLRRLAQAQEEEQRRISRELHDRVGQTVTGLSLGLKGLDRTLETEAYSQAAREQVHWLQELTNEIGRDLHRAASDLRPTALDDLGLYKALQAYVADWSKRYGVGVDFQTLGPGDRLSAEIETAVYRVVQESLTNVLKHADAENVSIVLDRKPNQLRGLIEDDGKGFDPEPGEGQEMGEGVPARPRLGLSGIRERLALVDGSLRLESAPGAGTTLFIQVPLSKDSPP